MTLGIKPTFPNTGFGYIEYNKEEIETIKKVNQFSEKPDYETTKQFLEDEFFYSIKYLLLFYKLITKVFVLKL